MYNIDYLKLILWFIPELLQFPIIMGYINALIAPFKIIHNDLLARRSYAAYRIGLKSQVCYFRKALNDAFDNTERRITITDGNRYNRLYIYTTAENRPLFVDGIIYMYERNDYSDTGVDFIIHVPIELEGSISVYEMRALADFCRLASKRYKIAYE